jgi:dTDP-4-dehydrorhamnose reductase
VVPTDSIGDARAAVRCLVTGAGGQLGRAVVARARSRGHVVVACDHAVLAVECEDLVARTVEEARPDVVFHCGAWTDVDGCERDPDRADRVNGEGTAHVATACDRAGARLVYVSTDFVFDGGARRPYRVDDPPAPLSAYGRSKLAGESAALAVGGFVVRTSWVFGPGGKNFPRAILTRARSGEPLAVVDDQVGCPTMTHDLAEALLDLAAAGASPGIYHAANEGPCSWCEFAVEILAAAGLGSIPIRPMKSSELDRPARRPAYSVLDCERLSRVRGRSLPHHRDALIRYLAEERH